MRQTPSVGLVVFDLGQVLRRTVWQPLHRATEIFHLLPATAAVTLFLLLFNVGQLREIYLSYLEDLDFARIAWALASFALISAALYESHYWLSTMRINVIYSELAYSNAGTNLRRLQRIAAFGWSLFPWAGLAAGLFVTRTYLENTVAHLKEASAQPPDVMLPAGNDWLVIASIIFLGLVIGTLFDSYRKSGVVQICIMFFTPVAVAAVFLLLMDRWPDHPVWIGLSLLLPSLGLCVIYHWLATQRIHFLYSNFWHADTGINPRKRRRQVTFCLALVPWILLALYFAKDSRAAPDFAIIPVAIICVVAIGLLIALTMDTNRQKLQMRRAVWVAIALPVAATAMLSWFWSRHGGDGITDFIQDFRSIGPLAVLALAFVFIYASFALLALLSQKSGFPALALTLAAVALSVLFSIRIETLAIWMGCACLVFVVLALISRLGAVALVAGLLAALAFCTAWREHNHFVSVEPSVASPSLVLEDQFKAWMNNRGDRAAFSSQPYPVFIIAVEGGGIYAAAAAALFLARLQDDCPAFAQHVFAISAVSGGAIGATIFQALSHGLPVSQTSVCAHTADGPLTQKVSKIVQDDHFSPVVASIVPDFLGEPRGRAETLQASFEQSIASAFEQPIKSAVADQLKKPFIDQWSKDSVAPALVLNSTWAETGYRVAFAPFTLNPSIGGDGTLFSFVDKDMPGESIPLMEAAVVSARFPGILPPYSVRFRDQNRWDFVDGGYADSSGAATALTLFNALKPVSCSLGFDVDLKVVLLSSARALVNVDRLTGSDFGDTMAPIEAVMNVRDLLGMQAVTRIEDYLIKKPVLCPKQQHASWELNELRLEEDKYSLPLGWKLSKTTFGLVSLLVGAPGPCTTVPQQMNPVQSDDKNGEKEENKQTQTKPVTEEAEEVTTLQHNGCTMKLIEDALSIKKP